FLAAAATGQGQSPSGQQTHSGGPGSSSCGAANQPGFRPKGRASSRRPQAGRQTRSCRSPRAGGRRPRWPRRSTPAPWSGACGRRTGLPPQSGCSRPRPPGLGSGAHPRRGAGQALAGAARPRVGCPPDLNAGAPRLFLGNRKLYAAVEAARFFLLVARNGLRAAKAFGLKAGGRNALAHQVFLHLVHAVLAQLHVQGR
nr:hypothetical protein [Tanacetum cinerariifolium]